MEARTAARPEPGVRHQQRSPDTLPNLRTPTSSAPAFATAGVRRYGLHAFRHYAVSSWLAAGIDLKQCQRWAGHADLATTLTPTAAPDPAPGRPPAHRRRRARAVRIEKRRSPQAATPRGLQIWRTVNLLTKKPRGVLRWPDAMRPVGEIALNRCPSGSRSAIPTAAERSPARVRPACCRLLLADLLPRRPAFIGESVGLIAGIEARCEGALGRTIGESGPGARGPEPRRGRASGRHGLSAAGPGCSRAASARSGGGA